MKLDCNRKNVEITMSLPARERGLKRGIYNTITGKSCVAPRTGAWIETYNEATELEDAQCRSPHGSVD